MSDTIHVKGLADLQKLLNTLPPKIEANVMRGALRAGMRKVKDKARININSQDGDLARALKVSTSLRNGIVKSVLAAQGFEGYKAMWVEYGTNPHLISVQAEERGINARLSTKRGKVVRNSMSTVNRSSLQIGGQFVGPTVFHPGARPFPFMRPALDETSRQALVAVGNYIKTRLSSKHGIDTTHIELGDGE